MPYKNWKINLSSADTLTLKKITNARNSSKSDSQRALILLKLSNGESPTHIAKDIGCCFDTVTKCYSKFKKNTSGNIHDALRDSYRSGKPTTYDTELKLSIINEACKQPKDLGYAAEVWSIANLLKHCKEKLKDSFHQIEHMSKSTLHGILKGHYIEPHKVEYYLHKRDDNFDEDMKTIITCYKEIMTETQEDNMITVSLDEKPGVQALANVKDDIPIQINKNSTIKRDPEYKRLGTVSILAGVDLQTGTVIGNVCERHRSKEFIELLEKIDKHYPPHLTIRIICDNHIIHKSKETCTYLDKNPERFQFVFTPKHGSWLNYIENVFSVMSRTFLKHIRVSSKDELSERISKGIDEMNVSPTKPKWNFKS